MCQESSRRRVRMFLVGTGYGVLLQVQLGLFLFFTKLPRTFVR